MTTTIDLLEVEKDTEKCNSCLVLSIVKPVRMRNGNPKSYAVKEIETTLDF